MPKPVKLPAHVVAFILLAAFGAGGRSRADDPPLAQYYGFLSPEIYKLENGVQNLIAADVNGDGLMDLAVINNRRNQIDVLLQRKRGEAAPNPATGLDVNEVAVPTRMVSRKIPMSRPVNSLRIKDVNGDKRPDLVYIGSDPLGLYVEFQDANGAFTEKRSFESDDASSSSWSVDVGDVNGDGRDDIVFLGKEYLHVVLQDADGKLEEPKRYKLSQGGASLLRLVDLDGDGKLDICYMTEDPQFPIRVRFQTADGRLGAERQFEIDRPRGVSYAHLEGTKGASVLSISAISNRLMVYGLAPAEKRPDRLYGQYLIFPFEKAAGGSASDLATADFDGDGKIDVLMSDGGGAKLTFHRQTASLGLDLGLPVPTISGVTALRVHEGGGPASRSVFMLSPAEKAVGWTRFDGKSFPFPELLAVGDEPVAMEVAGDRLFVVNRSEDKTKFTESFALRSFAIGAKDGKPTITPKPFGDKKELPLEIVGKPADLKAVDANGDGITDLLVFQGFDEPPLLAVGDKDGGFAFAPKSGQGSVGAVTSAGVFFGKLEGEDKSLIFAQSAFARKVKYDAKEARWQPLDQYGGLVGGTAKIAAVTAIDVDGDGAPELALYDRAIQSIVILKKGENGYRKLSQIKVGAFAIKGMRAVDLDGDGKQDLLLYDGDKMGVLYVGRPDVAMKTIATYESNVKEGQLYDVEAGDLNNDGRLDLLLLEPMRHNLEIVAVQPGNRLVKATRWQVFEEKTFRDRMGRNIEPRDMVIGDYDGDGRNDIALLVHDRLLVYLQDSGLTGPAAAEPAPKVEVPKVDPPKTVAKMAPTGRVAAFKDAANFFSLVAADRFAKRNAEWSKSNGLDVAVFTFPSVPDSIPNRAEAMSASTREAFYRKWGADLARANGVVGVLVIATRNPGRVQLLYGAAAKQLIPEANRRRLDAATVAAFQKGKPDEALAAIATELDALAK